MNVELLRRIQRHIVEKPNRFLMESFVERGEDGERVYKSNVPQTFESCGTAACFAGWAVILSKPNLDYVDYNDAEYRYRARSLLGLQWDDLFYTVNWPKQFSNRWHDAETPAERAQIASDVIDNYIETDGWRNEL
jgi:hypothetical protein